MNDGIQRLAAAAAALPQYKRSEVYWIVSPDAILDFFKIRHNKFLIPAQKPDNSRF